MTPLTLFWYGVAVAASLFLVLLAVVGAYAVLCLILTPSDQPVRTRKS